MTLTETLASINVALATMNERLTAVENVVREFAETQRILITEVQNLRIDITRIDS